MKKANVIGLATYILNDEIEKRGLGESMFVGDFDDELVFSMVKGDRWYMYKLTNHQCKKFFRNTIYKNEESLLDKIMRKAMEV